MSPLAKKKKLRAVESSAKLEDSSADFRTLSYSEESIFLQCGTIHLVRSQNFLKNQHFWPIDTHKHVINEGSLL